MQIRAKLGQIFKNTQKRQKAKQNICGQTAFENGEVFTILLQKDQVPTLPRIMAR